MIFFLILILYLLMVLIGGNRGAKSFAVLLYNAGIVILCIFLLGHEISVIPIMLISCIAFSIITIFYQNGIYIKTLASFLSTAFVFILMSFIIYFTCIKTHLTGFNEIQLFEEGSEYLGSAVNVNMLHIIITSMIWGELGAIIDTSMSISSVLNEIQLHNPSISSIKLVKSGMSVGKDILGTTINTLTFVALGESLLLTLYYLSFEYTFAKLINSKSFFQEISGILFSCIGCVIIIPITAFIFTVLVKSEKVQNLFK